VGGRIKFLKKRMFIIKMRNAILQVE